MLLFNNQVFGIHINYYLNNNSFYYYAVSLQCYFCIASVSSDCAKGASSAMVNIPCGAGNTFHGNPKHLQHLQFLNETTNDDGLKASCVSFIEPRK